MFYICTINNNNMKKLIRNLEKYKKEKKEISQKWFWQNYSYTDDQLHRLSILKKKIKKTTKTIIELCKTY